MPSGTGNLAKLDVLSVQTRCCLATATRCCCLRRGLQRMVTCSIWGSPCLSTPCWCSQCLSLTSNVAALPVDARMFSRCSQSITLCHGGWVQGAPGPQTQLGWSCPRPGAEDACSLSICVTQSGFSPHKDRLALGFVLFLLTHGRAQPPCWESWGSLGSKKRAWGDEDNGPRSSLCPALVKPGTSSSFSLQHFLTRHWASLCLSAKQRPYSNPSSFFLTGASASIRSRRGFPPAHSKPLCLPLALVPMFTQNSFFIFLSANCIEKIYCLKPPYQASHRSQVTEQPVDYLSLIWYPPKLTPVVAWRVKSSHRANMTT